jgi:O-antigen/teichoic acid export membrane protein
MNWKEDQALPKKIKRNRILANARKFKKFPKMSAWGGLVDTAATQMPIFIVTKIFGVAITGMYGMTFKVLNTPMALISNSISQVIFQKVAALHKKQPELLFNFVLKIFLLLLAIAIPFVVLIGFFGVELFSFVFGQNWAMAGYFAKMLSVAVAVRFTVSPLSSVLALNHNVERGVRWQLTYFITITATLIAASGLEINNFLLVFVIHEVVLYGLYLYIILVASRGIPTDKILRGNC